MRLGGLIQYAVKHYGVHALGVTLSRDQADFAREQIQEQGLSSRCQVERVDFRDLTGWERFNKIASVGSVEHAYSYLDDHGEACFSITESLLPATMH